MGFAENILGWITDKNKKLSSRATIFVLALLALLLIDNIFGFSENYQTSRQLDQLESIVRLKNVSEITLETKRELLQIEKNLFKRENIIDKTVSFFSNISWSGSDDSNEQNGRSNFWFLFSASGFYIIVGILFLPIMLITDKETPILRLLATTIMFTLIMGFTAWFNYWLLDKIIPHALFGSWGWNYVVNFLIQIGLILGYLAIGKYTKKSK